MVRLLIKEQKQCIEHLLDLHIVKSPLHGMYSVVRAVMPHQQFKGGLSCGLNQFSLNYNFCIAVSTLNEYTDGIIFKIL